MRRLSRLVCLLGGLLVLWLPEPASAEDGEGGAVRLEVGLISEQPLPIDVAGALWPALNVEVVCSDRSIAASSIEVSEQKERPSRRLVTARGLPPGKCTLAFTVHEASKEVVVPVRDGRVTRGEVMVEVAWSRFTLERLLDGD